MFSCYGFQNIVTTFQNDFPVYFKNIKLRKEDVYFTRNKNNDCYSYLARIIQNVFL